MIVRAAVDGGLVEGCSKCRSQREKGRGMETETQAEVAANVRRVWGPVLADVDCIWMADTTWGGEAAERRLV